MFQGAFLSWHYLEALIESPGQLTGVMIVPMSPMIAMAGSWCSFLATDG